jgi:hypothetical protein
MLCSQRAGAPRTPSLSNSRILFRSDKLGKTKLGVSQTLRNKSGYLPSLDGWRAIATWVS